ncbi:hypothetical protein DH2020_007795 [Rehmannia glutinosa]|uniref:phenylalanine--tRNA ligase n=1 Tax=Rehmannia glutinosa TaxID=99300 RepID=A0ABR0U012_REHGL
MPTVSVGRDRLFQALGRTYTKEEFEDLCFKFGIELDDMTTEKAIIRKEKHLEEEEPPEDEEVIYKIEVPANRYDLLCLEGLVQALRIFNGLDSIPTYNVASISKESMSKMHVKAEVCIAETKRRTLVAIGTHDLDTIEALLNIINSILMYCAELVESAISLTKNFRADELMEFYKSDMKLKKFLHIIENSPVFPVIYDRNRTVLSLPPIINGAHSAISLKTKNVFLECTATDLTKANIVLNTMVTMFSVYCERKFEVEPVEVIYSDGKSYISPDLSLYQMVVPLSYITSAVGVSLPAHEVACLLNKMQLYAKHSVSEKNETSFTIYVPPTRSDILHPCDVAEDVAIAYGYNEIPKAKLPSLKPQSLNQFSDLIRAEIAMVGYTEVLTWILCSYKENFTMLNRKDDKSTAAINGNPRSADFEVVRTSLMPGILKTVGHNKDHPKPIKIFEVGDVVLLDETKDVGASNHRHLGALYCGATSGFEVLDNFDIPDPCSIVEVNIENFL